MTHYEKALEFKLHVSEREPGGKKSMGFLTFAGWVAALPPRGLAGVSPLGNPLGVPQVVTRVLPAV